MMEIRAENNRRGLDTLYGRIKSNLDDVIDMIKRLLYSKCEMENINKVILVDKRFRIQVYDCNNIIRIDIKDVG